MPMEGPSKQSVFLVLVPHPLSFHLICTSAVYGLKPFINLSLGHAWSETTCRPRRNEGLALIVVGFVTIRPLLSRHHPASEVLPC